MVGALMGKVDGIQFAPTSITRWMKTKRKNQKEMLEIRSN